MFNQYFKSMLRLIFTIFLIHVFTTVAIGAPCSGKSFTIYKNANREISICYAPYSAIEKAKLNEWQVCDDALISFGKIDKEPETVIDCNPMNQKQFKLAKGTLLVLHSLTVYPGFDEKPMIKEVIDLGSFESRSELIQKLKSYTKNEANQATDSINKTVESPFDGKTYFDNVYSNMFILRDYAVADPEYVLSVLQGFKERKVFDGEVAETLSRVIEEVELIASVKGNTFL